MLIKLYLTVGIRVKSISTIDTGITGIPYYAFAVIMESCARNFVTSKIVELRHLKSSTSFVIYILDTVDFYAFFLLVGKNYIDVYISKIARARKRL